MLRACRLAGLSALADHYAGTIPRTQTSLLAPGVAADQDCGLSFGFSRMARRVRRREIMIPNSRWRLRHEVRQTYDQILIRDGGRAQCRDTGRRRA
jgi:hypothetical protein